VIAELEIASLNVILDVILTLMCLDYYSSVFGRQEVLHLLRMSMQLLHVEYRHQPLKML
jgi:hypothetical protein